MLRREVTAGVTTFLTMSYIVVVNPSILATEGTGLSRAGVMTATVLLAASMTFLMGAYAKLPLAVAPGMGLNAYFTFEIVLRRKVPWPTALGLVTWAGVLFLLVSVTPLRESIARAVPKSLRMAASAGIGLLLAFVGLRAAGLVVANPGSLVAAGAIGRAAGIFLVGLIVTIWMMRRDSPFALLSGIAAATGLGIALGETHFPSELVAMPDFSLIGKLDLRGALDVSFVPILLAIVFTDLFDSLSTFVGIAHSTGLVDEKGEPKNLSRGLVVDALATLLAGVLGTSAGTAYVESTAGIRVGGRTGLTAIVCALCFLPLLFFSPLASIVPSAATAPALVLVGLAMFGTVVNFPRDKMEETLPAFATLLLIPLTMSIAQGILVGFVLHALCYALAGRAKEVSAMMWSLSAISIVALVLGH